MTLISFDTQQLLINFIGHTDVQNWSDLQDMKFYSGDKSQYVLELPTSRLEGIQPDLLSLFKGQIIDRYSGRNGVHLQSLYEQLSLIATSRKTNVGTLLVMPSNHLENMPKGTLEKWFAELSDLKAFRTYLWPLQFIEGNKEMISVFRLEARHASIRALADLNFSIHTLILCADATESSYLPMGMTHPLSDYDFFAPPLPDGYLRGWFPIKKGRAVKWVMRHFRPMVKKPYPLVSHINVDSVKTVFKETMAGLPVDHIHIPLQITRSSTHQDVIPRRVRRIHRFDSSREQLGPRILKLLDQAEARVGEITYYCCTRQEQPESTIEHFILEEVPRNEGEDILPAADQIYFQPEAFHKHNLRIFLPRGARFCPSLDLMLNDLPDDSNFIRRLGGKFGLNGDPDAVAIVEPGPKPNEPRVSLLTGGRPLSELIQIIVENFHPVRYSLCIESAVRQLPQNVNHYHTQLQNLAVDESHYIRNETNNFLGKMTALSDSLRGEMDEIEARLADCREFIIRGQKQLEKVSADWNDYVHRVTALELELAEDRFDWLTIKQREIHACELKSGAIKIREIILENWLNEQCQMLDAFVKEMPVSIKRLEALKTKTDDHLDQTQRMSNQLQSLYADCMGKLKIWEAKLKDLRIRTNRFFELSKAKTKELREIEEHLRSQEQSVQRMEAANETKSRELEQRKVVLEQATKNAGERSRYLENIKKIEIPKLEKQYQALRSHVNELESQKSELIRKKMKDLNAKYQKHAKKLSKLIDFLGGNKK